MTYTEADRPDCVDGCGRKAALSKGELAYKGRCSRCYKEDVARRRAGKAADSGAAAEDPEREAAEPAEPEPGRGPVGTAESAAPEPGAGADEEPARKRWPRSCGWCIDGNHVAREAEPDWEDEHGITRPGRPGTLGCAAEQRYRAGERAGEPKGLQCDCHDVGHDRSKLAAK